MNELGKNMEEQEFEFEAFFYKNLVLTYIKIFVGLFFVVILPVMLIPKLIANLLDIENSLNRTLLVHGVIGFPLIVFFTKVLMKKFTYQIKSTINDSILTLDIGDKVTDLIINDINQLTFEIRENVKGKKAFVIRIKKSNYSIYLKAIIVHKSLEEFDSFFHHFMKILKSLEWKSNTIKKQRRCFLPKLI